MQSSECRSTDSLSHQWGEARALRGQVFSMSLGHCVKWHESPYVATFLYPGSLENGFKLNAYPLGG